MAVISRKPELLVNLSEAYHIQDWPNDSTSILSLVSLISLFDLEIEVYSYIMAPKSTSNCRSVIARGSVDTVGIDVPHLFIG